LFSLDGGRNPSIYDYKAPFECMFGNPKSIHDYESPYDRMHMNFHPFGCTFGVIEPYMIELVEFLKGLLHPPILMLDLGKLGFNHSIVMLLPLTWLVAKLLLVEEDENALFNMFSQGYYQPLGDDDELVSAKRR
jgi:hypothetical protein